jgi:hypothetical protein
MYSASVVDCAVIDCLLLDQLIAPPAKVVTYPLMIFWILGLLHSQSLSMI